MIMYADDCRQWISSYLWDFNHLTNKMDLNIEQVHQSIMDTAVDAIIVINDRGIVKMMNRAVSDLFQYTKEELVGVNVKILMTDTDKHHHDRYLHNYVQTRKPTIIGKGRDVVGRRKDGTIFDLRLAVSEVDVDGQLLFTGILHDITSLKSAQRNLINLNHALDTKVAERTHEVEKVVNQLLAVNNTLNHEIEERKAVEKELLAIQSQIETALSKERELNEMKSNFITTVSHEFRTPLASILSSASLISQYSSPNDLDKRLAHVDKIKKAANNLTALLTDILSLSRLEEEKLSVISEEVEIYDIINEIINELSPIFKTNQKIVFEKYTLDSTIIIGDSKLVKNILFNLVSNALKYSNKDVKISINEREDNKLVVSIYDNGIGIPQADQNNLFERFYRATNVGQIQGTGLGLHLVKKYCDLLKLQLKFESVENSFTNVSVIFNKHDQ